MGVIRFALYFELATGFASPGPLEVIWVIGVAGIRGVGRGTEVFRSTLSGGVLVVGGSVDGVVRVVGTGLHGRVGISCGRDAIWKRVAWFGRGGAQLRVNVHCREGGGIEMRCSAVGWYRGRWWVKTGRRWEKSPVGVARGR